MELRSQRLTAARTPEPQPKAETTASRNDRTTKLSIVQTETAVLHGQLRHAWERQQKRQQARRQQKRFPAETDTEAISLASVDEHLSQLIWEQSIIRRHCTDELRLLKAAALSAERSLLLIDGRGRVLVSQTPADAPSAFARLLITSTGIPCVPREGSSAVASALLNGVTSVVSANESAEFSDSSIGMEYAVPVIHPETLAVLAIIGLSSSHPTTDPMTLAFLETVSLSMGKELARLPVLEYLSLNLLGTSTARCDGCPLKLTRRQMEILALLALHPEGLSTEQLLAALYGDRRTGISTLKAEISRLRKALRGRIASRPYRLTLPVQGDFLECWQFLQHRHYDSALALLRGPFFSATDSPGLIHWRHCFEASIDLAMNSCTDECLLSSVQAANPDLANL